MQEIKIKLVGEFTITHEAKLLADAIYKAPDFIEDERFAAFFNRRFSHLLKLCEVVAASQDTTTITEDIIVQANTYLTYIQNLMPKALGEYGRSQDSATVQKVLKFIQKSKEPVTMKQLARQVASDVQNLQALRSILERLITADKIMWHQGGLILVEKDLLHNMGEQQSKYVDFARYLTKEELSVKTV